MSDLIEVEVVELDFDLDTFLEDAKTEILQLEGVLTRTTHEVRLKQAQLLLKARKLIPHGQFTNWVKSIGWSDRTARDRLALLKPSNPPDKQPSLPDKKINPLDKDISAEVAVLVEPKFEEQFSFRVGDRVRIRDKDLYAKRFPGLTEELLNAVWEVYRLEGDRWLMCKSECDQRLTLDARNVVLESVEAKFKVGDTVRIIKDGNLYNKLATVHRVWDDYVMFRFEYLPDDFRTVTYKLEEADDFAVDWGTEVDQDQDEVEQNLWQEHCAPQETETSSSEKLVENIFNPSGDRIPTIEEAIENLVSCACSFIDNVGMDKIDCSPSKYWGLKIAVIEYRQAGGDE